MATGEVARLTVFPLKKNVTEKDTSVSVDETNKFVCQFNPESLTVAKVNDWSFRADIGDDVPEVIFSGGLAGSLKLNLLFDTTESGNDVRERYAKLLKLSMIKPSDNPDKKGQPQQVLVHWGSWMGFVAIIQCVTQKFEFFKKDGTPLRAHVDITFRQAWDDKKKGGQNPTSRTEVRRTWVVERGQRLDWIAHQVYGNSGAWRHIAQSNGLLDPSSLLPGQILKIVPQE